MADDRLNLEARFNDKASAGVKKLGKVLEGLRPSSGMQAAQKWMGEFRVAAEKANVAVRPLSTGLSAVGIGGLAASLSMGELVKQFKELADSTLTMRELGRESRMSATEIARLQYAAGKLHVDPAAVSGAISSWSGKMVEFRRHSGRFYYELLRQNSDVARKIAADSPVDGLKDTLKYLSQIKDPQVQKRWAEEAGVGDLVPMLGKGLGGLNDAFAEAGREVKPISQELQAAADRFNDATNRFNQSWSNLKNDFGPSVLDPLTHTIDKLDEALKFAAQYPGDAAAAAGIIAGSFATLYARMRILRGSRLAGGAGLNRAAGELTGAAGALKGAAAALEGAKAGPGGGNGSGGPAGPGSSPGYANLTPGAIVAALNIFDLAQNMPGKLKEAETDNAPVDSSVGREAGWGDAVRRFFRGGAAAGTFHTPSAYGREARARANGLTNDAPNTDGNALRRGDEMPAARTAREVFDRVKEGSKAGIIAGLRELQQQQELEGGGTPGDGGAPNFRYGRAGGRWRTTPGAHSGGAGPGGNGGKAAKGPSGVPYDPRSATDQMGVSKPEWDAFREGVTDIEGKYYNRMGGAGGRYAGRYQMGPAEISDTARRLGVTRPSNASFLADPAMQERFFENYTMDHYRTLMRNPKFAKMSHREQLKILGYAHNQGTGGPTRENGAWGYIDQGTVGHDAFGTSGTAYLGTIQKRLDQVDKHASGGPIRGPGGPRADSIFAMLSDGEFVVNARDAQRHAGLLHAINSGGMPAYADGGPVAAGRSRRNAWLSFFQRSMKDGGMGASRYVALAGTAMMQGESGRNLDPSIYGWDVNGPSGGTAQWHDVTKGSGAGKVHRLSDLMTMAMQQHEDWHNVPLQQAWWKHEATGPLAYAWNAMRKAKTASGALRAGIDKFEVPADKAGEFAKRLPNIVRLARENGGGAGAEGLGRMAHDPVEVTIRHHRDGRTSVSGKAGRGVKLGIRSSPTMRPT